MSSFTTRLAVEPKQDGCGWIVLETFEYHVGNETSEEIITVPVGRETDFASIPKFLMFILPYWAKYQKPPIIHDELYKTKHIGIRPIKRIEADNIFLEGMLVNWRHYPLRIPVAVLEYIAVRLFGWLAWRRTGRKNDNTITG